MIGTTHNSNKRNGAASSPAKDTPRADSNGASKNSNATSATSSIASPRRWAAVRNGQSSLNKQHSRTLLATRDREGIWEQPIDLPLQEKVSGILATGASVSSLKKIALAIQTAGAACSTTNKKKYFEQMRDAILNSKSYAGDSALYLWNLVHKPEPASRAAYPDKSVLFSDEEWKRISSISTNFKVAQARREPSLKTLRENWSATAWDAFLKHCWYIQESDYDELIERLAKLSGHTVGKLDAAKTALNRQVHHRTWQQGAGTVTATNIKIQPRDISIILNRLDGPERRENNSPLNEAPLNAEELGKIGAFIDAEGFLALKPKPTQMTISAKGTTEGLIGENSPASAPEDQSIAGRPAAEGSSATGEDAGQPNNHPGEVGPTRQQKQRLTTDDSTIRPNQRKDTETATAQSSSVSATLRDNQSRESSSVDGRKHVATARPMITHQEAPSRQGLPSGISGGSNSNAESTELAPRPCLTCRAQRLECDKKYPLCTPCALEAKTCKYDHQPARNLLRPAAILQTPRVVNGAPEPYGADDNTPGLKTPSRADRPDTSNKPPPLRNLLVERLRKIVQHCLEEQLEIAPDLAKETKIKTSFLNPKKTNAFGYVPVGPSEAQELFDKTMQNWKFNNFNEIAIMMRKGIVYFVSPSSEKKEMPEYRMIEIIEEAAKGVDGWENTFGEIPTAKAYTGSANLAEGGLGVSDKSPLTRKRAARSAATNTAQNMTSVLAGAVAELEDDSAARVAKRLRTKINRAGPLEDPDHPMGGMDSDSDSEPASPRTLASSARNLSPSEGRAARRALGQAPPPEMPSNSTSTIIGQRARSPGVSSPATTSERSTDLLDALPRRLMEIIHKKAEKFDKDIADLEASISQYTSSEFIKSSRNIASQIRENKKNFIKRWAEGEQSYNNMVKIKPGLARRIIEDMIKNAESLEVDVNKTY